MGKGSNRSKRPSAERPEKNTTKKARKDAKQVLGNEPFGLVFYMSKGEVGVVSTAGFKKGTPVGTRCLVRNPIDWPEEKRGQNNFSAMWVKFGCKYLQ